MNSELLFTPKRTGLLLHGFWRGDRFHVFSASSRPPSSSPLPTPPVSLVA